MPSRKKTKTKQKQKIPSYALFHKTVRKDELSSLRKKLDAEGKNLLFYTLADTNFENLDCESYASCSGKFTGASSVELCEDNWSGKPYAKLLLGYRRSSGNFVSKKFRIDGEWMHCRPSFATIYYVDGSSYNGPFAYGYEGIQTVYPGSDKSVDVPDDASSTAITLKFPKSLSSPKLKAGKAGKADKADKVARSTDSVTFSGNIVGTLHNKYKRTILCSGTLAWASKLPLGVGHQCLLPLPLLPLALTDLVTEYQEHFALRFSNTVGHPPTLSIHQGLQK